MNPYKDSIDGLTIDEQLAEVENMNKDERSSELFLMKVLKIRELLFQEVVIQNYQFENYDQALQEIISIEYDRLKDLMPSVYIPFDVERISK